MKPLLIGLLAALCGIAQQLASPDPGLSQVQRVYLLSMGSGLDQFIANHLVSNRVYQVVTDPEDADAIFSDTIGLGFEKRLKELYRPAEAPKPELADADASEPGPRPAETETVVRVSTFGRGKGNYFLIDRKSRRVLWSVYQRPKDFRPEELDKAAARIVDDLRKTLNPGK